MTDSKIDVSQEALALTETSLAEMRNVLNDLRPACLDEGLDSALEAMCDGIDRIDGFNCEFRTAGEMPVFDEPSTLNIYRLIQEALTNVVKHSQADNAVVTCHRADTGIFHISIVDDGIGFDPHNVEAGIGISSMGDRVKMMGGDMRLISQPGCGTKIEIEVPLDYD